MGATLTEVEHRLFVSRQNGPRVASPYTHTYMTYM